MGDEPDGIAPGDDGDDAHLQVEPLTVERLGSARPDKANRFGLLGALLRFVPRLPVRLLRRLRLSSGPRLTRAVGLLLLAALLLATVVTALRGSPGTAFPLGGPAAPAVPTHADATASNATPAPTRLPTPVWGSGWTRAGPAEAQRIVFAPSAPAVAYTCGAPTLTSFAQPVPLVVQVSLDRGHTWQPALTPATGVQCDLTVNPVDAQDVVLATLAPPLIHPVGSDEPADAVKLYRSFDGGASWHVSPLPVAPDGARDFWQLQWEWSAGALFVAPLAPGDPSYHRLAVSVGGQTFGWVEQEQLFAAAGPDNAGIVGLIGTDTALYVVIYSEPCAIPCRLVMRSADAGASWSRFAPTYQGAAIVLLPGDGETGFFGEVFQFVAATPAGGTSGATIGERYVRGREGDPTWGALPAPPEHLALARGWELPDGSVYAALDLAVGQSLGSSGLYTLASDASSWVFVAPYPAGGPQSLALSWDGDGHPLALWGTANSFLPHRLTGLEYFPL